LIIGILQLLPIGGAAIFSLQTDVYHLRVQTTDGKVSGVAIFLS
jgi:hypothetical protein